VLKFKKKFWRQRVNIVFPTQAVLLLSSILLLWGFGRRDPSGISPVRDLGEMIILVSSVRYTVHRLEFIATEGTRKVLILALQGTLSGVYTHSINDNNYYALFYQVTKRYILK
jgi:hypothetical protein